MTHPVAIPVAVEPAFLRGVRLRAQRRVLWLRHWWSSSSTPPSQGLAISDADVDRFLADPAQTSAAEAGFYRTNPEARALSKQAAEAAAEPDQLWSRLCTACALNSFEADLLALALAVEADLWWRRVCGYLHDDATLQHATPWLASCLFEWDQHVRFGPDSALLRWALAKPVDQSSDRWSAVAGWAADPHLLAYLTGNRVAPVETAIPLRRMYPEALDRMTALVRDIAAAGLRLEIEIAGPPGSGRRTLARQLAAQVDTPLLIADASALQDPERLTRTLRQAALTGSALYWDNAQTLETSAWSPFRGMLPLTIYGVDRRLEWPPSASVVHQAFTLPPLQQEDRGALWSDLTGGSPAPPMITETPLLPEEIAIAAAAASAAHDTLTETCRAMVFRSPGDLFTELPLPYQRDDLVVLPSLRQHLDELEAQTKLRFAVLEDWGFSRLSPMGQGLTALFAGPSGTGKTMAAQVLARSLGLALRRVDLSSVVNKYIGETEKRLKLVFDACERDRSILFFDEADALFGQRTQVRDAHDRFANIEINYLLQRMEQFNGLAILATNRKEDLDRAFLRRLRFIIDFPAPGPAERLEIWKKSLPLKSPKGEALLEPPVDWNLLADKLELTGAGIKSVALSAAFLARSENSKIAMRHILSATRRELSKHGHVLRAGDLER